YEGAGHRITRVQTHLTFGGVAAEQHDDAFATKAAFDSRDEACFSHGSLRAVGRRCAPDRERSDDEGRVQWRVRSSSSMVDSAATMLWSRPTSRTSVCSQIPNLS